jgi:hypothetical protein
MSDKIELKEKIAAVDLNYKSLWNEIDDEQRKSLKNELFILNRYISNVKTHDKDIQEHFVLTVNEYFNKHWNVLQKNHPKLLWMLLCMCGHESKKLFYHEWIGQKKKKSGNQKVLKLLEQLYSERKDDELAVLSLLITEKEAKQLAEDHGYTKEQITKIFK